MVFEIKDEPLREEETFKYVDEIQERENLENWARALHIKDNFVRFYSMKTIVQRLNDAGLETKLFYSVQRDEVYCKIRCPPERLGEVADKLDYRVQLDEERTRRAMAKGRKAWKGRVIEDVKNQCIYSPFEYMYGKYDSQDEEKSVLYKRHKLTRDQDSPFRGVDRIKLILEILKSPVHSDIGGCGFTMDKLVEYECILAYFPLHDQKAKILLEQQWLRLDRWPSQQPISDIKDYFGEKIALYFGWLGHYTTWLLYASAGGLIAYVDGVAEGSTDSTLTPAFATFIAIWSTLFLESWKRQQITYVMQWGMKGFEEAETNRPQFQGKTLTPDGRPLTSPIDGEPDMYFPPEVATYRALYSNFLSGMLVLITLIMVAVTFVLKIVLSQRKEQFTLLNIIPLYSIIPSALNGVQITVMSIIYSKRSLILNEYENHRTDTSFEDALISKTFGFEFINKYAALMYIAFVKKFFVAQDFCVGSCFSELGQTLGIIFLLALALDNTNEVYTSFTKQKKRQKEESAGVSPDRTMSKVEEEYTAETFDKMLGTFKEYAEMTFQFGYATLFSAAFPIAPLLALINNFVEIRIDAWKLLTVSRRPEPSGAEDIGTWYTILELMATTAVVTNGILIFFVGDGYDNRSWTTRFVYFLVFEHLLLGAKFATAAIIPDVPTSTEIQLERQKFVESKVIDNLADDDDSPPDEDEVEGGYEIASEDPDPAFEAQ